MIADPQAMTTGQAFKLQADLMEDDQQRLSALLQEAGYKIVCDLNKITVNERALLNEDPVQHIEYLGVDRKAWNYKVRWNGVEMAFTKRLIEF